MQLVMVGGGGHCISVLDAALSMHAFSRIVITDPMLPVGSSVLGCEVVGSDDELADLRASGFSSAFITVGSLEDARLREELVAKTLQHGFSFPVICDSSAIVSPNASLGDGTYVGKSAVINAGVSIGEHCIVNTGAVVEHGCVVGDYAHVSANATLCGNVSIGAGSFIGAGSTVIQGVNIGCNVVVGANSTVLDSVEDSARVYGIVKRTITQQARVHDKGGYDCDEPCGRDCRDWR